jgi:hypothetical protein
LVVALVAKQQRPPNLPELEGTPDAAIHKLLLVALALCTVSQKSKKSFRGYLGWKSRNCSVSAIHMTEMPSLRSAH